MGSSPLLPPKRTLGGTGCLERDQRAPSAWQLRLGVSHPMGEGVTHQGDLQQPHTQASAAGHVHAPIQPPPAEPWWSLAPQAGLPITTTSLTHWDVSPVGGKAQGDCIPHPWLVPRCRGAPRLQAGRREGRTDGRADGWGRRAEQEGEKRMAMLRAREAGLCPGAPAALVHPARQNTALDRKSVV